MPNRNGKHPSICFDHLQRDRAHHGGRYTLGQYPCHGVLGDSQYFCLADEGSLRNEYMCGDASSNGKESIPPSLPPASRISRFEDARSITFSHTK